MIQRRRAEEDRLTALPKAALALRWGTALVASSAMVFQASSAAFNATTSDGPNTWSAGTVAISDDDSATAMFTATNLKPLQTGTKCIQVTYDGSLAAAVKLYGAASGTLGTYLNLTVEEGTGGTFASCTGFTGTSVYSGTGRFRLRSREPRRRGRRLPAPGGRAEQAPRLTHHLHDNNAAQAGTASATFTWEAQNV